MPRVKCNFFVDDGDRTRRCIGEASFPIVPESGDDVVLENVIYTVEKRCLFEDVVNVVVKAPERHWQIIGSKN